MQVQFRTRKLKRQLERSMEAEKQWGTILGQKAIERVNILASARDVDELRRARSLRLHQLRGDRQGEWAVTLTANYRLIITFPDGEDGDIVEVIGVEDYHGR